MRALHCTRIYVLIDRRHIYRKGKSSRNDKVNGPNLCLETIQDYYLGAICVHGILFHEISQKCSGKRNQMNSGVLTG